MTVALIDGDIVVYRCAFASERNYRRLKWGDKEELFRYKKDLDAFIKDNEITEYEIETYHEVEPLDHTLSSVKSTMSTIIGATKPSDFRVYLTKGENYRHKLATIAKYKGNRDEATKPVHYDAVREYLTKYYDAEICEGIEADDMLALHQTDDTVICSIDKDLLQVPGKHYNWVTDTKIHVTGLTGLRNLWSQVLSGDKTDNIPGIHGIAKITADKMIAELTTEEEMRALCIEKWTEYLFGDKSPPWVIDKHPDTGSITYTHWDCEDQGDCIVSKVIECVPEDIVNEIYSLVKVGRR